MSFPVIAIDGNDVLIFEKVDILKSYIESPDVERYSFFGFDGMEYCGVSGVSSQKSGENVFSIPIFGVDLIPVSSEVDQEKLKKMLSNILKKVSGRPCEGSLEDIIEAAEKIFGIIK